MPLPGATNWAVAAGIQLSCSQTHFIRRLFPKETMVEGPWRTPRPPRMDSGSRVTILALGSGAGPAMETTGLVRSDSQCVQSCFWLCPSWRVQSATSRKRGQAPHLPGGVAFVGEQ